MSQTDFENCVDKIEQQLDSYIDNGSDQELFLSGYLHGHFSLVVSELLLSEQHNLSSLEGQMQVHLQKAFNNNELEVDDQHQVQGMWNKVLQGVKG